MLFVSLQKPQVVTAHGCELRLDCFPRIDKEEIRALCTIPVIFTLRKASQGGQFKGSEKERLALIEDLLTLKPDYVDLESDVDPAFIKKIAHNYPETKILLSYHNFTSTPEDLPKLLKEMQNPYVYAYKIATMANSSLDSLRMLAFVRKHASQRICGICMGEKGKLTRILGPVFGSFLGYAPPESGGETAPGQLCVSDLEKIYHYSSLNPSTALYGLIGDPVDKSIGYLTHNAVMRHYKWNAVYLSIQVKKEELPAFFKLAKTCGFSGLSVTMPHKEELFSILDRFDPEARKMGAVNTIHFSQGELIGYNTDGAGTLDAIESRAPVKGKKVVLLGAGGASRAIAYEAIKRGAKLLILNRTKERALTLAKELGCRGGGFEEIEDYDVIINGTPDEMPIDSAHLIPHTIAMEIKTVPKMTRFLQEAQKKKCRLVYGYELFLFQALGQFRIWFNSEVDKEFLEKQIKKCFSSNN